MSSFLNDLCTYTVIFVVHVVAAAVVFLCLFPLVHFGLKLIKETVRPAVSRYAMVTVAGFSLAIAHSLLFAFIAGTCVPGEHTEASLRASQIFDPKHIASEAERASFIERLDSLRLAGTLLLSAAHFINCLSAVVIPASLLPPMTLFIWDNRRRRSEQAEN